MISLAECFIRISSLLHLSGGFCFLCRLGWSQTSSFLLPNDRPVLGVWVCRTLTQSLICWCAGSELSTVMFARLCLGRRPALTHYTALPNQWTGHRSQSVVLCWVCDSNFLQFFCSSNNIHTNFAFHSRPGSLWCTSLCFLSKNFTPPRRIIWVFPFSFVLANLHDLMAKN